MRIDFGKRPERRLGEKEPLHEVDPGAGQKIALLGGLDAFGERDDAKAAAKIDDAFDDDLFGGMHVNAANQIDVDLDEVRLKPRQQVQSRVAGAEVVDHSFDAQRPVFAERSDEGLRVLDPLSLSHLNTNRDRSKPRSLAVRIAR
jgi:hypothetical protein